jgi:protoporphyrinogen oxidase
MTAAPPLPCKHWGVVGGGMLGLTVAHRLALAGQRVTVYERGDEIGGLAGAWQLGDAAWDKHYHVTLLSDAHLRGLLDELGLADDMRWVETRTGFYTDGRLHSMSNTLEFLRFPPLRLVDKLRLGLTIFAASRRKNWRTLEHVLVGDWLRRWSGERTFRKIWEPLLLAKLGECYRRTSAAFIWATIQRMYAARRSGLKKEMFGYVRGGYGRVLARFAEVLLREGVELQTGVAVRQVSTAGGRVHVETQTSIDEVDRVVLTCASPVIAKLCPDLGAAERVLHAGIEYLGIVCASVLLDQPLADYYVTNITDGGVPFTAVIEMTALVDRQELGGRSLVYLPRYAAANDEVWGHSDAEIEEQFLAGLERMYRTFRRSQVRAFRVSREKFVMALPTLGYSDRLPPMTAAPHIFAVHSAHIVKGTLNVNEVVELANDAVARVLLPSLAMESAATAIQPSNNQADVEAAGELVARS